MFEGQTSTVQREIRFMFPTRAKKTSGLSMNRPTPDPSREGSRRSSASCRFPSWEGLGVGSWSQCVRYLLEPSTVFRASHLRRPGIRLHQPRILTDYNDAPIP